MADDLLDFAKIALLREARGLAQRGAAGKAGFSAQRWADIERGRKPNIELGTLATLARVLGVSPCDLLRAVPPPAKPRRG